MDFKPGKLFVGAAVAISFGIFAVPFNSIANASTIQERLSHSESRVQLAQADSKVEEKTEQKTTQSTDSAGIPQADKHVEHETTETANDSNGSAKTQHKAEVNESTNAMGDTTNQTHETTESSQHN
jgi:hypothetical protein